MASTRAPLQRGESVRCSGCGRVVAVLVGGRVVVKHKRREVVIERPVVGRITCEMCGSVTRVREIKD
jgi:ribosomal protein S27E